MKTKRASDPIVSSGSQPVAGTVRSGDKIISSSQKGTVAGTSRDTGDIISSGNSGSFSGTITLNNQTYTILQEIAKSGESEIFLIEDQNKKVVLKYYYSQYKPKKEIVEKLKGLKHPDIIALLDYGYYENRFFEISEFAEGGTLIDRLPIKDIGILKHITNEVVNALDYCHNDGIIHRDIKPQNIFYLKNNKHDIAIGDFGISSILDEGFSKHFTGQARTPVYAAPEVFQSVGGKTILGKEVDYYSLGMVLLHLWSGEEPFNDKSEFIIMRLKIDGRVFIPDDMPGDLKNLVKGLITVEPPKRWGYNEVQKWLKGENVTVYYKTHEVKYKDFLFGNIDGEQLVASNPVDLSELLGKYPAQGKKHLYKLTISDWVKEVNPALYIDIMSIVEDDYPKNQEAGLIKAIYLLNPDKPFTAHDGMILSSQEDISKHFEDNFSYYENDLQNSTAPFYLFLEARELKQRADDFRNLFQTNNHESALNAIIFELQGADRYILGDSIIYEPKNLLTLNDETQSIIIKRLINLNSKLSLWISGFPELKDSIDTWRKLKRYDQTTLRYAVQGGFKLGDTIVKDENEFRLFFNQQVREFFNGSSNQAGLSKREDAGHWLKNYCSPKSSLEQVLFDNILSGQYNSTNILQDMLSYALVHCNDINMSFYSVFTQIIPTIKLESENVGNAWVDEIILKVALIIKDSINMQLKTKNMNFLFCLDELTNFAVENKKTFPVFFEKLFSHLNNWIAEGIRTDIKQITNNDKKLQDYKTQLSIISNRLKEINPTLPYLERVEKENNLASIHSNLITETVTAEKQSKMNTLTQEYDNYFKEKQKIFLRSDYCQAYNKKIRNSVIIAIVSLLLLLTAKLGTTALIPIFAGGISLILTLIAVAIIIGIIILFFYIAGKTESLFLAGIVAVPLGFACWPLVSAIKDNTISTVDLAKIVISIVLVISIGSLIYFGSYAYYIARKKKKEFSEIKLDSSDLDNYNNSVNKINDFHDEKTVFEINRKTANIMVMEDEELTNELQQTTYNGKL